MCLAYYNLIVILDKVLLDWLLKNTIRIKYIRLALLCWLNRVDSVLVNELRINSLSGHLILVSQVSSPQWFIGNTNRSVKFELY